MLLAALVLLPLIAALLCLVAPRRSWLELLTVGDAILVCGLAVATAAEVMAHGYLQGLGRWLYADALSALTVLIIAFVGATAALYSIGYLRENMKAQDAERG